MIILIRVSDWVKLQANPAQELHWLRQVIRLADNCSHFIVHLTCITTFRTVNLSRPTRLFISTVSVMVANQTTPPKDLTMLFGIHLVSLCHPEY